MAQTMGSCTRPGTKLHSWPQELCTDSYLSTPSTSPCPLCEDKDVPRVSLLSHVIGSHMSNICDSCELLSLFSLVTDSDSITCVLSLSFLYF